MVATKTEREDSTADRRDVPTVGPKVEFPAPKLEAEDLVNEDLEAEDIELEERVILPWYRRVPAPGLTGLRHYPGYGKR